MGPRKAALGFIAAAALPISVVLAYITYHLGSPLHFGQTEAAQKISLNVTGSDNLWSTPFLTGAAGLLISPSRNFLVFSPFPALAFWGSWKGSRTQEYRALGPVAMGVLGLFALYSKYFAWYSGVSFGYRMIVEATPILTPLCLRIAGQMFRRRWILVVLRRAALWSILLQAVASYGYDPQAWNLRRSYQLKFNPQEQIVAFEAAAGRWVAEKGAEIVGRPTLTIGDPK